MFDDIFKFFHKLGKKEPEELSSKDMAKERLHLVLMQDRANVSADFLDMMKQEIIDVIKKYIDVDENEIDVRLTNKVNEDGTTGAPALYANIPITGVKQELQSSSEEVTVEKKTEEISSSEIKEEKSDENPVDESDKEEKSEESKTESTETPNNEENLSGDEAAKTADVEEVEVAKVEENKPQEDEEEKEESETNTTENEQIEANNNKKKSKEKAKSSPKA